MTDEENEGSPWLALLLFMGVWIVISLVAIAAGASDQTAGLIGFGAAILARPIGWAVLTVWVLLSSDDVAEETPVSPMPVDPPGETDHKTSP